MRRPGRALAGALRNTLFVGALWGAVGALIEAGLFTRWLHVGLQKPLALFELVLNYAIYAGVGIILFHLLLHLFGIPRGSSPRGAKAPDPRARLAEAIVGAGIVIFGLANYLQVGPLGPLSLRSPVTMVIGVGALALIGVAAWAVYRLNPKGIRFVRTALVLWVIIGLSWGPLFGKYGGVFGNAGKKAARGTYKNVLFIITDTLRADFLDCYGGKWGASPATDRVAVNGTLFEKHIAQSTWTLPSVASILTGLYPSSHGAIATAHPVSSTAITLAEVIQSAGFHTGAFTENTHILPRNGFGRGFDHFWAYWLPWVFDDTMLYRFGSRLRLPTIELTGKAAFPNPVTKPEQVNWDARTTTDAALEWLGGLDDSPFLAYVHYMGPHGPYGPPEFLLDIDPPAVAVTDHPRPMGGAYPIGESGGEATDKAIELMRTLYAADVRYVEFHIDRILDYLIAEEKLSETLIVLTSDHGEEFYEHGVWNHGGSAFRQVLRVPLVIYAPSLVPSGKRVDEYTRHIDVLPTVVDLLGLDVPREIQGRSLKPLLDGESPDPVPAYVEVYPLHPPGADIFALVKDGHKIIDVSFGERSATLLYDLVNDPAEMDNLADANPEMVDSLLIDMEGWDRVARHYNPDSGRIPLDSRRLKMLKSLGYINQ